MAAGLAGIIDLPASAQSREDHRRALESLAIEADAFDKSAHRVAGIETLRQTLPRGSQVVRNRRGVQTVLPERTREIVSEYGFVALDERGGWLKEARIVVAVDGATWKKGNKGLETLARTLSANDEKKKRSLLEGFEDFGLQGFITDLGQLILLFARGLLQNYELTYEFKEPSPAGDVWVYRYSQLSGSDAMTIYEAKVPIKVQLRGRVWIRAKDYVPVQISVESERPVKDLIVHDISVVQYEKSSFGFVLPSRITHEQFVNRNLFVKDEFVYSDFKELVSGSPR
ncbi:MAG TPA: hypothetical protein VEQ63_02020 [Bryobacteraceae bacterium]|nr:hypothetical protein [Bryobacteraceae bacterium]